MTFIKMDLIMALITLGLIMVLSAADLIMALSATDLFMTLITMVLIMALNIVDIMNQKAVDTFSKPMHIIPTLKLGSQRARFAFNKKDIL
jgi:hypothetical protein